MRVMGSVCKYVDEALLYHLLLTSPNVWPRVLTGHRLVLVQWPRGWTALAYTIRLWIR